MNTLRPGCRLHLSWLPVFALALALAGCGGGGITTVGGTVTGLTTGTAVTLLNNGGDSLAVAKNGTFQFAKDYSAGNSYNVTIDVQPAGLACTVTNGSGTIDSSASKVTSIRVDCVAGLSVGGTVTGLASGNSVILENNGTDPLTVAANSAFTFPKLLAPGTSYEITVLTQPANQTCTVTQGTGTLSNSNVSIVSVSCI